MGEMRGVAYYAAIAGAGEDVQYPNAELDGWMLGELERQIPKFDYLKYRMWIARVRASKSGIDLLSPPVCVPPRDQPITAPAPAVVAGELVKPKAEGTTPAVAAGANRPKAEKPPQTLNCAAFRDTGKCKHGEACKRAHVVATGDCEHSFKECPLRGRCLKRHAPG